MTDDALYFSDREKGPRTRTEEIIPLRVWGALHDLIQRRIDDGSFGFRYPDFCPDGMGPSGTDTAVFWRTARAEIPGLPEDRLRADELLDSIDILDLLEFCAKAVARPIEGSFHSFFRHSHLSFEREPGLTEFVSDVNRLFARNGIALELSPEGVARRLAPPVLREALLGAVFHSGDPETDKLLEDARRRILSPKPADRQDAIEKLWDAFERVKTLEPGANKKDSITRLLDRVASRPKLRMFLENEARQLTEIGNNLRIRHAEITTELLETLQQADYLFHRLFGFLFLLLSATGRASVKTTS